MEKKFCGLEKNKFLNFFFGFKRPMGQNNIHCNFIELEFGAGARAKERGASAEE